MFHVMTIARRKSPVIPRLLRDNRLAALWFAVQAIAVGSFWVLMALWPPFDNPVLAGALKGAPLWAFAAADLTVVATSVVAALAAGHRCGNAWVAMVVASTALAYPTAYYVSLSVIGRGGEAAAVGMLGMTITSIFFAVASLPFTGRLPGRIARTAGTNALLVKTTAELAVIWSTLLWLLPSLIVRLDIVLRWSPTTNETLTQVGASLVIAGGLVLAWAAYHMAWRGHGTPFPLDAPKALVVDGPYAYVRNPQVVGGLIQGFGLILLHPTTLMICFVIGGVFLWQVVLRPWEEADLADRFQDSYRLYQSSVPCWRPRLRRSGA
jgi:protein-S-isoprenylcysteine O-methyltransferase Ste14